MSTQVEMGDNEFSDAYSLVKEYRISTRCFSLLTIVVAAQFSAHIGKQNLEQYQFAKYNLSLVEVQVFLFLLLQLDYFLPLHFFY